jgi:hypothetical protein
MRIKYKNKALLSTFLNIFAGLGSRERVLILILSDWGHRLPKGRRFVVERRQQPTAAAAFAKAKAVPPSDPFARQNNT